MSTAVVFVEQREDGAAVCTFVGGRVVTIPADEWHEWVRRSWREALENAVIRLMEA